VSGPGAWLTAGVLLLVTALAANGRPTAAAVTVAVYALGAAGAWKVTRRP
jgi:hypothetical protein